MCYDKNSIDYRLLFNLEKHSRSMQVAVRYSSVE